MNFRLSTMHVSGETDGNSLYSFFFFTLFLSIYIKWYLAASQKVIKKMKGSMPQLY